MKTIYGVNSVIELVGNESHGIIRRGGHMNTSKLFVFLFLIEHTIDSRNMREFKKHKDIGFHKTILILLKFQDLFS